MYHDLDPIIARISSAMLRSRRMKAVLLLSLFLLQSSCGWVIQRLPNAAVIVSKRQTTASHSSKSRSSVALDLSSENSNNDNNKLMLDTAGKTLYQRVFYQLLPKTSTDLSISESIVVEERVRFEPDPDESRRVEGYIQAVGHRTIILRDGRVKDGEIGKPFLTVDVHDGSSRHNGAGLDASMTATMGMILYLASNPQLCQQGRLLEMSSGLGIASLLGVIGAGYVTQRGPKDVPTTTTDPLEDIDILSIPKGTPWLPSELESLTLSDPEESNLEILAENAKISGIPAAKIFIEKLDWSVRDVRHPMGAAASAVARQAKEYRNILLGHVACSYPEAKLLARAIANRLEPSYSYIGSTQPTPRFVHVFRDDGSEQSVYLQRFLEQGYRMSVAQGYIEMEQLLFHFQALPQGEPESALDKIPLQLSKVKTHGYVTMSAEHSVDYGGEGSGEYFFPMETGQYYENKCDQRLMERDWDTK